MMPPGLEYLSHLEKANRTCTGYRTYSCSIFVLAGIIFGVSSFVMKVLGEAGSKALSKITSLLLAAIAIMLIRKGLVELIQQI